MSIGVSEVSVLLVCFVCEHVDVGVLALTRNKTKQAKERAASKIQIRLSCQCQRLSSHFLTGAGLSLQLRSKGLVNRLSPSSSSARVTPVCCLSSRHCRNQPAAWIRSTGQELLSVWSPVQGSAVCAACTVVYTAYRSQCRSTNSAHSIHWPHYYIYCG